MLLDTLNRLTIGTTIPDSMFNVAEGVHFERGVRMSGLPSGVGIKSLRVDANGTVSLADTLANGISGTGTTNYIPKFTSSSAIGNSQIFDNGTNVGIGTITAGSKLEVYSGNLSLRLPTYLGTARYGFGNPARTDDAAYIEYSGAGNFTGSLIFATNGTTSNVAATERMRLDASGNLLLGMTTAPSDGALAIKRTGSPAAAIKFHNASTGDSGSDGLYLGYGGSDGTIAYLYQRENDAMVFGTNNTERMRLDASGNLGLGTSSPATKLDVNGNISVTNGNYISLASNNPTYTRIYRSGALIIENNSNQLTYSDAGNLG